MTVDNAKKILSGNLSAISPEVLQDAAKKILSEFIKMEEKIFEIENNAVENLPNEIWRDIEGYEGFYKVSNKGRVKSFCKKKIRLLKIFVDRGGYCRAGLCLTDRKKHALVHRLVAKAFIPNPKNLPEVNHIDGNKLNNCVENLEWVTKSENIKHAYRIGLYERTKGAKHHNAKLTEEAVKFIRENYKPGDIEFGTKALAKKFNVNRHTISRVLRRKHYANID